ncbi:MAG: response regulator transcription factor [Bdellovibrionales bacterium]|nr:response regulator transcription factor [Bdellovibrionales bacterium]
MMQNHPTQSMLEKRPISKKRILLVEDDPSVLSMVKWLLQGQYEIITNETGANVAEQASEHRVHLILLDIRLPQADGLEICKALRETPSTESLPILIFSGNTEADARVAAFLGGADDFIAKPFLPAELVARIESKLHRMEKGWGINPDQQASPTRKIQPVTGIETDPSRYEIIVNGNSKRLSVLEFKLLGYFLDHPERVIPREELLEKIWPETKVIARTVDAHLVAIRKALKESEYTIKGIYGAGYMLTRKEP